MERKSFNIVDTKAEGDEGEFVATVAVFGNVDKGGDRIVPGAFKSTLERWRASGDPIPIILSHSWDDPFHHVGVADPNDVVEAPHGLVVRGQLDVSDNDVAKQVYRLMKRRSLREFSFGYSVPKGGQKRAKDGANELLEIDLVEVGPTLKGMNPSTELHAVKSALKEEVEEPKSAAVAQREADDLRVDLAAKDLPPATPEEKPDPFEVLSARIDSLAASVAGLTERVEGAEKAAKERAEGAAKRAADPLRKRGDDIALEFLGEGLPAEPPKIAETPRRRPELEPDELKRLTRDWTLQTLSGIEE